MNQDWIEATYSLDQLRSYLPPEMYTGGWYVSEWLYTIGVVHDRAWKKVFSTYPLLNRYAIKAGQLASLALEWDREGPSDLTSWLDMVELECSPKRDRVIEALESASELSS